jgi:glycosyltransferase involved in cell wall biosynthesis
MSSHLSLVVPAPFDTRTGGYEYDRSSVSALRGRGWTVDVIELPGSYPQPSADERAAAMKALAAIADGGLVLADGLAFGALPNEFEAHRHRLRIVALVHHPLAAETGLSVDAAERLFHSEREALAAARHVIVTSPATAASLAEYNVAASRISVVPPGTEPAPLASGSSDGMSHLLAIGSIIPRKGYGTLIRALAQRPELPWQLTCAGSLDRDRAEADAVLALVSAAGLSSRITFVGELGAADLARVYDAADLFVLPTVYEGYGMVVAEALARGLPVISTPTGGIADLLSQGGGVIVPANDARALAAALAEWLTDAGHRDALRDGARRVRPTLPTWPDRAALMERVLRAVS